MTDAAPEVVDAQVEVEEKKDVEMKEEAPKQVENIEKEQDEEESKAERYSEQMSMNSIDGTLNVNVSGTNIVSPLATESLALLATCRANVGITSGRYLVEYEVLQSSSQQDIRVGFSLESASVFLGDKQTLCFTSSGQYFVDGECVTGFRGRRLTKGEVVGLLLNRTDNGNAKTVSLFINGQRVGEPQAIPDSFDGTLYPHISVKNACVSINWNKTPLHDLPFKVRTIGDAIKDDVTQSPIKEVAETTVIIPFGNKTKELVEEYILGHTHETYTELTREFMQLWQEKSGSGRGGLSEESMKSFIKLMTLRKRNYIFANNHFMLAKDRKEFCSQFSSSVKKIILVSSTIIEKLLHTLKFSDSVTLPTKDEGFSQVEFMATEAECQKALAKWQKSCKLATKVDDLKCGEWFKEQLAVYEKLRDATRADILKKKREAAKAEAEAAKVAKAAAEGKEPEPAKEAKKEEVKPETNEEVELSSVDSSNFSDEDWVLCDLRVELHLLVHAFRTDVEDKERTSFCPEHLSHYYRLYSNNTKMFSLQTFGAKTVAEALEIIPETIAIEDGMLKTLLPKEAEFDEIIQHTEDQRQERTDRIGAGDEGAHLKFKAKKVQSKGKGDRGNKGVGKGRETERDIRTDRRLPERPPRVMEPPRAFNQGRSPPRGRGGRTDDYGYTMRPIPSNASKRPSNSSYPPAKRTR